MKKIILVTIVLLLCVACDLNVYNVYYMENNEQKYAEVSADTYRFLKNTSKKVTFYIFEFTPVATFENVYKITSRGHVRVIEEMMEWEKLE